MFLGHDASWWGVALAITGLVLMVPTSIFATMITPAIQYRLSQWMGTSLTQRIAKAEAELAELEQLPPLTLTEDYILKGIDGIFNLIIFTMYMSGPLLLWTAYVNLNRSPNGAIFAGMAGVGCISLAYLWKKSYGKRLRQYLHDRSPRRREELHRVLDNLRKLPQ